jgi:hypothetical protein
MYNHELINKMIDRFDMDKVTDFAEMVSFMHDVLYQEDIANGKDEPTEHNFERDWWKLKHEELKSVTA